MSDALVEVRLLELPVPLWARSHEQAEALQREFALVAADPGDVPQRLLQVVTTVRAQYAAQTGEQEDALFEAADAGVEVLTELRYQVPPEVGQAAAAVGRVFDEADEYCRRGQHLLTLAPDEEIVTFRRWFLEQFIAQVGGAPAVPWPAYRGA